MAPPSDKRPRCGWQRTNSWQCLSSAIMHFAIKSSTNKSSSRSMETLTMSPFLFNMKSAKPYTHPHLATTSTQRPTLEYHGPSTTKMTIHSASRSELLCRYPSKLCDNLRSEKRGGGLHRFCAFHRERANINQRRVDHRRRLRRRNGLLSPTEKPILKEAHSSDEEDQHGDELVSLDMDINDTSTPLCSALSEDDLQVLISILEEPNVDSTFRSCMPSSPMAFKQEPMSDSI